MLTTCMFGRLVAWGGARIRPHACCVRRDHPLPVAAGAATLFPIVAPALPRGPRNPSALRALGALPSFFVRLRRRVGGQLPSRRPARRRAPRPRAPRPGRRRRAAGAPPAACARAPRSRASASRSTSTFQPDLHRLDPLGRVAQRHARDAGEVRLLLDAAGVGQHRARVAEQRGELEVARAAAAAAGAAPRSSSAEPARRLEPRARARVERQHGRQRQREQQVDERTQPRGVVDVARAVRRDERVLARRDAGALERRRVARSRAAGRAAPRRP